MRVARYSSHNFYEIAHTFVSMTSLQSIKNDNLIESYNPGDGLLIIKRENEAGGIVKLSDVFEHMPSGIVTKEETGMGATTLELTANRNSIIVEPIKVTASLKAIKHEALYIGSPTKAHPTKVSDEDIRNYWRSSKMPKKFVVVADSLSRLIKVIGQDLIDSTFLMLDEIDSFQTDASFRERMEDCIDVYKAFPNHRRAMVSATTMDFSDPALQHESKIIFKYDKPNPRDIDLFCSEDVETTAFETIVKKLINNKNAGIMIAYNSVMGCKTIANELVERQVLSKEDIKILCSESSKELVSDYYAPLTTDRLPGRINFLTSAYFTGYDLNQRYHLISISGNKNIIHSLSEKELKQIAGRCRKGVLSETIIFDEAPFYLVNKPTATCQELIAAAEIELEAIKCIERNYSANSLLKDNLNDVRDLIIAHTTNEGHKYIRKRQYPDEALVISYLNIDAYLEATRVRKKLYSEVYLLLDKLRDEGHIIRDDWAAHSFSITKKNDERGKAKRELVLNAIQTIRNAGMDVNTLAKATLKTAIERAYVTTYLNNCEFIDNMQLLELLIDTVGDRDSRRLNDLQLAAFYVSLSKNEVYKRTVKYNIKLKQLLTKGELLLLWNKIYAECGLHIVLTSTVKAVRLTNLHFKTGKKRKGDGMVFKILADNPLELKVTKQRAAFQTNKKFTDYYLAMHK